MEQRFKAGDLLFFQLESGFALIKLLAVDEIANDLVWQVTAFGDLFPDVESIENAVAGSDQFSLSIEHAALTNRAFESTQMAAIGNVPLTDNERARVDEWSKDPGRNISDLSIRLLMGLR